MKLKTQKKLFAGSAATAVLGLSVWGLSGLFSGAGNSNSASVRVPQQQTAPAPVYPVPAPPPAPRPPVEAAPPAPVVVPPAPVVKKGDTADEKAQKLAALQAADRSALAGEGFTGISFKDYGFCRENGTVDGSGWHGVASGVSYTATFRGAAVNVCVSHKGGKPQDFKYEQIARPPAVPQPQQQVQPGSLPYPVVQPGGDPQKADKIAAMNTLDAAALADNGFTVRRWIDYGQDCKENGTLTNNNWKGVASSLTYEAVKNGITTTVCVTHKGGKPQRVTGHTR